jgi:prevent-host-death family protein
MGRTVSATEARIRFGELMRRVTEEGDRVIVERAGKPHVVVLSVAEYKRLQVRQQHDGWRAALEQVREVRDQISARRGDEPLSPSPEEIIRRMREERSEQLTDLR